MEFLNPSKYAYIPLGEWIEKYVKDWLFAQRPVFKKISVPIESTLDSLDSLFNFVPLPIVILFFVFAAFLSARIFGSGISISNPTRP